MSTCTAFRFGSVFSIAGMANAAVLPEPVCDWPTTSRAAHEDGDGLGLDRRGLFKAEFFNGLQDFGRKAEFRKKFYAHRMSFDYRSLSAQGTKRELIRRWNQYWQESSRCDDPPGVKCIAERFAGIYVTSLRACFQKPSKGDYRSAPVLGRSCFRQPTRHQSYRKLRFGELAVAEDGHTPDSEKTL